MWRGKKPLRLYEELCLVIALYTDWPFRLWSPKRRFVNSLKQFRDPIPIDCTWVWIWFLELSQCLFLIFCSKIVIRLNMVSNHLWQYLPKLLWKRVDSLFTSTVSFLNWIQAFFSCSTWCSETFRDESKDSNFSFNWCKLVSRLAFSWACSLSP
jgi:hypothetical protein